MDLRMEQLSKKISDISDELFTIFGYCPQCSVYHLIDTERYADFTLEDMSYKADCPECGCLGLDSSIIPNDK